MPRWKGFVRAAACELPAGSHQPDKPDGPHRIGQKRTTASSRALKSVPAATVAQAYRRSVEGVQTGRGDKAVTEAGKGEERSPVTIRACVGFFSTIAVVEIP